MAEPADGQYTLEWFASENGGGLSNEDATKAFNATSKMIEATGVYYQALGPRLEKVREAEKKVLEGWKTIASGTIEGPVPTWAGQQFLRGGAAQAQRARMHPNTFLLMADELARNNGQPSTFFGLESDPKADVIKLLQNFVDVAANFGNPLVAAENEPGRFHWAGTKNRSRLATDIPFHHYVFTDSGQGGNSVDWSKTSNYKFYVQSFYMYNDERLTKFQDGDSTTINRWISMTTKYFPYIHAYLQQYNSTVPSRIEDLIKKQSDWTKAVKWSFAGNQHSYAASNIGGAGAIDRAEDWTFGEVHSQVIDEAYLDAFNADNGNPQHDYLVKLTEAEKVALGVTEEAIHGAKFYSEETKETGVGWLKAPHSIQYHGSLKQLWKAFVQVAQNPYIQQHFPEVMQIKDLLDPGAAKMKQGISRLAAQWAAIREIAMVYLATTKEQQDILDDVLDAPWYKDVGSFLTAGLYTPDSLDTLSGLADALQDHSALVSADQQRNIFKEQCFLLSYIKDIAGDKKARDMAGGVGAGAAAVGDEPVKSLPYINNAPNSTLLIDGDPYGFLNRLTQSPSSQAFFNTPSQVLNHLQPRIKLYKISYDKDNKAIEDEFIFDSSSEHLISALQDRPTPRRRSRHQKF